MYRISTLLFLLLFGFTCLAQDAAKDLRVLIVPYQPHMHLSDADVDISMNSEKTLDEIRTEFRESLLRQLQTRITTEYDVRLLQSDYVAEDRDESERIYHSLFYQNDTVWPVSHPRKDSLLIKKKLFTPLDKKAAATSKTYINIGFYDQQLIPDLSRKYSADVFLFLNEFDIRTDYNTKLDKEKEIYAREIKVHYSVFDRNGKQVYGDVAVARYPSDVNQIDEVIRRNFPGLADYIFTSVKNR